MIETIQYITRCAASFEIVQAEALVDLLGGGARGIINAALLTWAASIVIMLYGTLARLRA